MAYLAAYLRREGLAFSSVATLAPQTYCRGGERGSPDPICRLLLTRRLKVSQCHFELRGSD